MIFFILFFSTKFEWFIERTDAIVIIFDNYKWRKRIRNKRYSEFKITSSEIAVQNELKKSFIEKYLISDREFRTFSKNNKRFSSTIFWQISLIWQRSTLKKNELTEKNLNFENSRSVKVDHVTTLIKNEMNNLTNDQKLAFSKKGVVSGFVKFNFHCFGQSITWLIEKIG